jgi:hypothetical protein
VPRKSVVHLLAPAKFWHGRLDVNSEWELELPVIKLIHQQIYRDPEKLCFGHSPLTGYVVQLYCLLIAEVHSQRRSLPNRQFCIAPGLLRHMAPLCNYMTIHEITQVPVIFLHNMCECVYVLEKEWANDNVPTRRSGLSNSEDGRGNARDLTSQLEATSSNCKEPPNDLTRCQPAVFRISIWDKYNSLGPLCRRFCKRSVYRPARAETAVCTHATQASMELGPKRVGLDGKACVNW